MPALRKSLAKQRRQQTIEYQRIEGKQEEGEPFEEGKLIAAPREHLNERQCTCHHNQIIGEMHQPLYPRSAEISGQNGKRINRD